MRIALIATHHSDYAANLARALAMDHEVMLVLSRRSAARQIEPEALSLLRRSVRVEIVPHHYAPLQPLVARLCQWHIARFRPDIVHVQEHPTRSMGLLARHLGSKLPLVTTVHDPKPHSGGDSEAADAFAHFYEELRGRSDGLIVHGQALIGMLAQTGVPRSKIRSIMHGVLRFGHQQANAAAASSIHAHRLIFFGRVEAYKGLDTLLAANVIWRREGVPIKLLIAGTGPDLDRHRDAMRMPNITLMQSRIPQDALAGLVGGSLAAILPYHDATQSGVIASAFGAGRPVIATDVGALAEAVGDAGLIVPPQDPEALAEAGRAIVENEGLRQQLERAVAARVEGPLGWDAIAAETAVFYRELLSDRA
ncbi:glycosyltransferase family 4 protein [Novosphingopyxis iocasae]|uniref:glycosyltransferase family 4 protein n=1 Tax=Novosphingopyxis iocasae TaxID=2762729 RepID=UPI001650E66B|nr:glycosyltransferase [Novosphingopyxis iocasae]